MESFTFQGVAGVGHYLAIFRTSDGHVFDWSDSTFKAFGSASQKTEAADEITHVGGTSRSLFSVAVDLSDVNDTSTPVEVVANWFTDSGATTCVSTPLVFRVSLSAVLTGDPIPELTGDPGATPTEQQALAALYMDLRNGCQIDKSPALRKILNDAGEVVLQATLDDNGTRFLRGKMEEPE